ncbi:helix-turn-helix domain-containing protein [uncultured Methanobrevibacter sp.]|uniref:helix-turn-helix domain-containing protein n=1 Tax=uncultured Methanobrevibacter sp. TaxID=253161 RepID=UPI002615E3D1|nr:helix-turn-helix transcriptional regulator [uncultured Methanobrevibacter sp.]
MEKLVLLKKFGANIKKIRESKGLAQIDLAVKMGYADDATSISRIEAGRTNPTLFTIHKISTALDMPMADLLDFNALEE